MFQMHIDKHIWLVMNGRTNTYKTYKYRDRYRVINRAGDRVA